MIENGDSDRGPPPMMAYALPDLLEQMTAETFPHVAELGPIVGQEIW